MSDELTADEIRKLLELEAHAICGFVRVSFVSKQSIGAGWAGGKIPIRCRRAARNCRLG